MKAIILPLLFAAASAAASDPAPPAAQKIVEGIWLIPEVHTQDREPDGNTVVFRAPKGLIVMDTGRHAWHRQAILDFAVSSHQPIVAVVNSHWHLDHVSGNPSLRASYPQLKVYASDAIDGALKRFLAEGEHRSDQYLSDPGIPEGTKDDIRADSATIRRGTELRPDEVIGKSGVMDVAGLRLGFNLAVNAATAGDVWLYDPKAKLVAVGDLVTLPLPYLDTACPEGWSRALSAVEKLPFAKAAPGHGPILSHADFSQYHRVFDAFVKCAHSDRPTQDCGAVWSSGVEHLLPKSSSVDEVSQGAVYYADMLRANGGASKYCEASRHA